MNESVLSKAKVSRLVFGVLLTLMFSAIFGPSVYGHFIRQGGSTTGFGYGYGYGYGYGLGYDGSTIAGHRMHDVDYVASEISYNWRSLEGYSLGVDSDDEIEGPFSFPAGFNFEFYGEPQLNYWVSSNGFMSFFDNSGDDGCCDGTELPDFNLPNDLIAGAWSDLDPGQGGIVKYEVLGTAPNRVFILEFNSVEEHSETGYATFQIQLFETSNIIEIHTQDLYIMDHYVTQGVESASGLTGTYNPDVHAVYGYDSDGGTFAWRFTPVPNGMNWQYEEGYGYLIPGYLNWSSWNGYANRFDIGAGQISNMLQAGILVPNGTDISSTSQVTFFEDVKIWMPGVGSVLIANGTTLSAAGAGDFSELVLNGDSDTSGLGGLVLGDLQFGLPTLGLTVSPAMTVSMNVGATYNGQTLNVWHQSPGSSSWDVLATCVVADGLCDFTTTSLSSFAAAAFGDDDNNQQEASLTLARPIGGEVITGGTSYQIGWASSGSGIDRVRISLSSDGGASYPSVITSTAPNSGFYTWSVPSSATTTARIKVEALSAAGAVLNTATSSSDFSIYVATGGGGGGGGSPTTPTTPGGTTPSPSNYGTTAGWTDSLERSVANEMLPEGFMVDDIVKLADDGDPTTDGDSTVYYIGLDAKRHAFMNRQTFMTWYPDFSLVKPIDDASLAAIPLGGPVMPRPGTMWVKITSTPETYFVSPDGHTLRWISDEATAIAMGGTDWNTNVMDIDVSLFTLFSIGSPITTPELDTGYPAGQLLRSAAGEAIWYITPTGRRLVANSGALAANHFQDRFVETLGAPGWQMMIAETPIVGFEEILFSQQYF